MYRKMVRTSTVYVWGGGAEVISLSMKSTSERELGLSAVSSKHMRLFELCLPFSKLDLLVLL